MIDIDCLLQNAVDGSGGFIGFCPGITLQQLRQARFVEIASRAFTIGLDPFRVLQAQIVMNLKLKRCERVARTRPSSLNVERFRSDEHDELDNNYVEVVQIDALKIYLRPDRTE